jgi:glycerol dehydrogenase-like iron-containing ADH family enzyme
VRLDSVLVVIDTTMDKIIEKGLRNIFKAVESDEAKRLQAQCLFDEVNKLEKMFQDEAKRKFKP